MSREIVNTGGSGRVSSDAMKFAVLSIVVAIVVLAGFWIAKANYQKAAALSAPTAVVSTV